MDRIWIGLGALAGLLAVAMAAAAAHLPLEPPALTMLRDGVQMQGWHALALFGTGIWTARGGRLAHLGVLAPTGGFLLMAGWALLGLSAIFRA